MWRDYSCMDYIICPVKRYVENDQSVSTKDEVTDHELRLNLNVMVLPDIFEDGRVRSSERGISRVLGEEFEVRVNRYVCSG